MGRQSAAEVQCDSAAGGRGPGRAQGEIAVVEAAEIVAVADTAVAQRNAAGRLNADIAAELAHTARKALARDVPTHCEVEALGWRWKRDRVVVADIVDSALEPRDLGRQRIETVAA